MWRLGGGGGQGGCLSGDNITTRHSLLHENSPQPLLSRRACGSSHAGRCLHCAKHGVRLAEGLTASQRLGLESIDSER